MRESAETAYMWGQRDGADVVCPGSMSQVLCRGASVVETDTASRIVLFVLAALDRVHDAQVTGLAGDKIRLLAQ